MFSIKTSILKDSNNELIPLEKIIDKKDFVLDFWHVKCGKCPATLDKLNDISNDFPNVTFSSCALSLEDGDIELIKEMVDDNWENLLHLYMNIENKELAKKEYDFSYVPFCLVFSDSKLIESGDPRSIDFKKIFTSFDTNDDF